MKKLLVLISIPVFLIAGVVIIDHCVESPKPESVKHLSVAIKNMPPNHTNVVDLGNRWYTFELETEGQKRKFLFRWWYCGAPDQETRIGTNITELK